MTATEAYRCERSDVSACLQHPKFDIDLRVSADDVRPCLAGRIPLAAALAADGSVRLDGAPALVSGFGQWFAWSPMAPGVREAAQRR